MLQLRLRGDSVARRAFRSVAIGIGLEIGLEDRLDHKLDGSAQRFLNIQSAAYSTFYHERHLLRRPMYKELRTTSFEVWQRASVAS